jgi:uncharacterized protein YndB with AHSA1/START domain
MKYLLLLVAVLAHAKVMDSGAGGFTIQTIVRIKAAPEDVYRKLVGNVGDWWNPAHTFSQDAHNLRIEDRPGGCFCEKLPNNGFVRHLEVILAMPGKRLVMSGAFGPLQHLAATGSMLIQFKPEAGGTELEVTYRVTGYLPPPGMEAWSLPVDMTLGEQFTRFKSYVETGSAASK